MTILLIHRKSWGGKCLLYIRLFIRGVRCLFYFCMTILYEESGVCLCFDTIILYDVSVSVFVFEESGSCFVFIRLFNPSSRVLVLILYDYFVWGVRCSAWFFYPRSRVIVLFLYDYFERGVRCSALFFYVYFMRRVGCLFLF